MFPSTVLKLYVVCLISLISASNIVQATNPIVEIPLGKLQGTVLKTDNNNDFYAFRGIPYAKPPIKDLRFKAPEPIERWNGIYDATEDGHPCIQVDILRRGVITGDEDCLYLNVYSPQLAPTDPRAVMVFIHGGGFISGSGRSDLYGPERLLDKDIVLVTINYRLSALGFLSTEDSISPGNNGLMDQVQALRWVRDNVAALGGDPQRVTIFGESAGSASVIFHLLSPLSKGLFQAAIAQSGSAINSWATYQKTKAIHNAKLLADSLKCPTYNSKAIVECLRRRPALDVAIKSSMFNVMYTGANIHQQMLFLPVVEEGSGGETFLPEHPQRLMETGQINRVPVMMGINKDEGIVVLSLFSTSRGGIEHFQVEDLVNADRDWPIRSQGTNRNVYKQWMERVSRMDPQNHVQRIGTISNVLGDVFIVNGVDKTIASLTANGIPTYTYKLTYRGQHTYAELFVTNKTHLKYIDELDMVTHADELRYLFRTEFGVTLDLNENDSKMANIILTLWTNFAKNRIPSLNGSSEPTTLEWTPVQSDRPKYLNLNLKPTMEPGVLSFDPQLMTTNDLKEEL